MKNHLIISLVAGIILSVAALYFAFRNVPFNDLLNYLWSINYLWLLPAALLALVSFFFRAVRWQFILASSHQIGIWQAFHPLMIGFMINCILPGRVGEIARPMILQKKAKIPFATGFATVAAERIFDVAALILFTVITFASIEINPQVETAFGDFHLNRSTLEVLFNKIVILGVLLLVAVIMVSISRIRRTIQRIILNIPMLVLFADESAKAKITAKICEPLIRFVDNIALGFTLIKHPKRIFICGLYSLIVWMSAALSYYVFSLGCPGINLSYTQMYAVMVIICLFIALPSVPGYWGLWEAGGVFAMSLFGISENAAAGFTLANHAVQVIPVIIVGFISAIITSVNIWQVSFEKKSVEPQTG
jgi:uncharacterized protein (TIRG00374 family)